LCKYPHLVVAMHLNVPEESGIVVRSQAQLLRTCQQTAPLVDEPQRKSFAAKRLQTPG
jgi:hypothetical protein